MPFWILDANFQLEHHPGGGDDILYFWMPTFIVERHFYFGRHFGFCTQLPILYANLFCFVWFRPAGAIISVIRPPPIHQGPAGASAVGTLPTAFPGPKCPNVFSGSSMTGAIIMVICPPPMFQGYVWGECGWHSVRRPSGTSVSRFFVWFGHDWDDTFGYLSATYVPGACLGRVLLALRPPPFRDQSVPMYFLVRS
jgi:hypothetical protein